MLLLFTTLKRWAGRQMQFLVWTCNKTENTLIHLGHHSSDNHGSCTNAWKKNRQVKSRLSLWFLSLFCAFHCFLWSHMEGTKRTWKRRFFYEKFYVSYALNWVQCFLHSRVCNCICGFFGKSRFYFKIRWCDAPNQKLFCS